MVSTLNQSQKRERLPWVTYALLMVCSLSMLHSKALETSARPAIETAIAEAAKFWEERPYLNPPDILADELTQTRIDYERDRFQQKRDQRGAPGIPGVVQRHSQEHLDRLTAAATKPLANLPRHRIGFSASNTDPSTYLTYFMIHSGWLHLLGNAIILLFLGHYLERRWGHLLYGLVALSSSFAAATLFSLGNPGLLTPLIGTSGIAAGLLGAYMVRFAPLWKDLAYPFVLLLGASWLLLPAQLGWENSLVASLTPDAGAAAIAAASYWAIGGGFASGLFAAALIMLADLEPRVSVPISQS